MSIWTNWIAHDDSGWPRGIEPDEAIIADIAGDIMQPMPASDLSWHCPGDPVIRYRRRTQLSRLQDIARDVEQTHPAHAGSATDAEAR